MKETEPIISDSASNSAPDISFPYDIAFPDSASSPGTRLKIEEYLAKLERHFDRITSAKVFVRIPHKHGGLRLFHIHIQLEVPGRTLVVSREPELDDAHSEPALAIKDAFDKMTRQLENYAKTLKKH